MGVTVQQEMITTPRGKFAVYRNPSDSKKRNLICLHGGPGLDSTCLRVHFSPLVSNTFNLIFIDLKGDGASPCFESELNLSIADYALDILDLHKHLALSQNPTGIYGHSFGGFIALDLLSHPQNPFSFGIVSNTCANFNDTGDLTEVCKQLNISADVSRYESDFNNGIGSDQDYQEMCRLYARFYYPEFNTHHAEEKLIVGKFTAAPYIKFLQHIVASYDLESKLNDIKMPMLILGSELDYITPPAAHERLARQIRDSSLVLMRNVGHFPFVAKADEYKQIIQNWVNTGMI